MSNPVALATAIISMYCILQCRSSYVGETTPPPTTPPNVYVIADSTTQAPSTQAPRTEAPSTQAPSTEAPSTLAPSTEAPSTQAPSTEAPSTQAPSTEAPSTQAPSTEAPSTQAPSTEAPSTTPPNVYVVADSTTQAPSTQAPSTEAPSTQAPSTEAPSTQAPNTEAPSTQAPNTEAPSTEAPSTEAPTTQAPSTEAPTTQGSNPEYPGSEAPNTQAPSSGIPSTEYSNTEAPSTESNVYVGQETPSAASTDAPTSESPSTQALSTDAPSTQAPSSSSNVYEGSESGESSSQAQTTTASPVSPTTASSSGGEEGGEDRVCRPGSKHFDKCRQLCKCSSDGGKWECYRQRKEFTTMTRRERKRFIQAFKELARTESPLNKRFNELITNHKIQFMSQIHQKKHFLTWHRWFLLQLENLLRDVDCRVTLPYWDWSAVSGDPWGSEPGDLWYNGTTGFGGNGNPTDNYCVSDGPFCNTEGWKPVPSSYSSCERRRFRGTPPDAVAILELLETEPANFTDFELALRIYFHDSIHCLVGGTMCSLDSAASPVFFLHHCFIDKIWDDWQSKSEKHKLVYFEELNDKMPGTQLLPKAVVDNLNLPGDVKVEYLEINDTETQNIRRRLKKLSRKQLRELKRPDFDDVNEEAMVLFNVRKDEKLKAKRRAKKFRPKNKKDRKSMKSRRGKRRGFDEDDLKDVEQRKDLADDKSKYKVEGMSSGKSLRPRPTKKAKAGSNSEPGSKYKGEGRLPTSSSISSASSQSSSKYGEYGGILPRPTNRPSFRPSQKRPQSRPSSRPSLKSSNKYEGESRPTSSRPSSGSKSKSVSRYDGEKPTSTRPPSSSKSGSKYDGATRPPNYSSSKSHSSSSSKYNGNMDNENTGGGELINTEAPRPSDPLQPSSQAPTTEAPGTETPSTEAPNTEASNTEASYTEAPNTEAPGTEVPNTEAPNTEAPNTEAPGTEAPNTEAPNTEAPSSQAVYFLQTTTPPMYG